MVNIDDLKSVGVDVSEEHKDGNLVIDVFTVWCGPCSDLIHNS